MRRSPLFVSRGESSGSTPTIFIAWFFLFKNRPTPVTVPPGADTGYKNIHFPAGILPNFGPVVSNALLGWPGLQTARQRCSPLFRGSALPPFRWRLSCQGRRGQHQLRPIGAHQHLPLCAHRIRHDDNGPIAARRGNGTQANAVFPLVGTARAARL